MNLKQNAQSLSFIIYGLFALSLLMLYNGFASLYGNILADFVMGEKQDVLLFNMSYGSATSLLFIGTLVFFLIRYLTSRMEREGIIRLENGIRFWILGGIILIGSLFAAIDFYNVLTGVMTGRSDVVNLLVTLVTLISVSAVILFSLSEIKRKKSLRFVSPLSLLFLVVCLGSIVAGFLIAPPWTGRQARQDQKQLQQMQNIKKALESKYYNEKMIPNKLDDLHSKLITNREDILDILTGKTYAYKKISNSSYELCAHFLTNYDVYKRYRLYPSDFLFGKPHHQGSSCFVDDLSLEKPTVPFED